MEFDPNFLMLLGLLLLVAALYSAVGHGGGSSYIALFVLFGLAPSVIRPTALILNILVAGVGAWNFYRAGHIDKRLLWPFLIGSIPAAFAGGLLQLDAGLYKKLLAVFLLLVSLRLFVRFDRNNASVQPPKLPIAVLVGALIGFVSGVLGIGGGIILSPIIILSAWGNPRQAASTSALFILLNSMAGLAAIQLSQQVIDPRIYVMAAVVLVGGIAGSFMGSRKLDEAALNRVLGVVMLVAGLKLLLG